MSTIIRRGNRIVDMCYISEKFGLAEMDITNVEETPIKEVDIYLKNNKERRYRFKEREAKAFLILLAY